MVQDAVQTAVQIAQGLTRSTRERASAAAHALLGKAGLEDAAAGAQDRVGKVADEILAAGRANGQLINNFVSHEVDQAVDRLGLARRSDLDDLTTEIAGLRAAVASLTVQLEQAAAAAEAESMAAAPRRRPRATAARSADAVDDDDSDSSARPTPPSTRAGARKTPAKKGPAKKAAKKAPSAKAATAAPAARTTAKRTAGASASETLETTPDAPPLLPTDPIEVDETTDVIETGAVVGPFEPDPIPVYSTETPADGLDR